MRHMDLKQVEKFTFTRNWFRTRNLSTFVAYIHPVWAGKPITYLELGVFEGMSLCWMMQHVLTHPEARAVGIDPWLPTEKLGEEDMDAARKRAFFNLAHWPLKKAQLIRANSAEILRRMARRGGYLGIKAGSLDLSMVDGNHNALAVWDDARLVYELLKLGGIMYFDDVENDLPKRDHVKEGVGLFTREFRRRVKLLWKHRYMEAYQKIR